MNTVRIGPIANLPLRYANRHGLITGPTGCGKSVSLMTMAEQFSRAGVPVFLADVKGDISAISRTTPARLLDLFGERGEQVSASIGAFGPDTMARALELSEVQAGALEVLFTYAGATNQRLGSVGDLRNVIARALDERQEISAQIGQIGQASLGVIQRAILGLERQGGAHFFSSKEFDVSRLLDCDPSGHGVVSILAADRLMGCPRVYAAFLLWMLTDLYERLPEVGDQEKPRLAFFFDEAHLLFSDMPKALLRKVEQTVRLIRSKGVGVYFVTQRPEDVPQAIREQLATRIEHDRWLAVGTARVTHLDGSGRPVSKGIVRIDLPSCQLGALAKDELNAMTANPPAAKVERVGGPGELVVGGFVVGLLFCIVIAALSVFLKGPEELFMGAIVGAGLCSVAATVITWRMYPKVSPTGPDADQFRS
ncbi:helicase HerA-like domain-containing protein [Roseibium sediminis]|uniref:helicase HerA-like domain-containing protein n=1 Tax=Roseibium sediminis TaxID=1775174 RepID=UPI00123D26C2|nr:helicase HerA-like domain-containing protein [Roseibium sediminis]